MRIWIVWSVGLAATTLIAGCALPGGPTMPTRAPADFLVTHDWREGSVPPPFLSSYQIRVGPDGAGTIEYHVDYGPTPVATERFTVPRDTLEDLYTAMVQRGIFSASWLAQDRPPVGGGAASLEVVADGRRVAIPSLLQDEGRAGGDRSLSADQGARARTNLGEPPGAPASLPNGLPGHAEAVR